MAQPTGRREPKIAGGGDLERTRYVSFWTPVSDFDSRSIASDSLIPGPDATCFRRGQSDREADNRRPTFLAHRLPLPISCISDAQFSR
ncbi:hypothetical protein SAMN06265222_11249 [Neorhodopirellula lusitana]|uniref:Uncharacterized protein n=1 Tax=Neorhodopirellula lusitana TaxID=445327 RepID=A0ABY1QF50_9BACT|nr:hypothetical protein SAMN06265222_11249 [Neorhodopirellula lusitana]